jgi:hypothetical protein
MSKYRRWKGIVLASYDTTTAVFVCDSAVRNTELGRSQGTVDAILSISSWHTVPVSALEAFRWKQHGAHRVLMAFVAQNRAANVANVFILGDRI